MTHKKMIYGGAAVFLLGLIIWAIVTVPETPSPDAPSGPRIMSYENNTIHEERDGRTVWTLTAKRVNVDIDTASVDTGSDPLDEHLRGNDFFDSTKYPKATYKSTKVVFKGDKPVSVEGNLTIKGVTKPVTMTIDHFSAKEHPMKRKDALGAKAHMTIKRSDFGLSKFVPAVSDDVTITVRVEAVVE